MKRCWSILALEDHPDLRETLKGNFADVVGEAMRLDFAASICQAVDKIKRQMRRGDPYDVFWIDLYLDYFSYDNEHGEIISVDSFSQIVDTEALLRHLEIGQFDLYTLITKLHAEIIPAHKSPESYTDRDKLRLLQKFLPFCLPVAKSTYQTFLELLEMYLSVEPENDDARHEVNVYARYTLDYVFRRLLHWVKGPRPEEFSLYDEEPGAWQEAPYRPILPDRQEKSDQSWTIFQAWARQFYSAVALGAKETEGYAASQPLLLEIKKHAPNGYPQFLVNTAYGGRQQEFLRSVAIWPSQSVIVPRGEFKGEKKDREFLEHLFRICRRLRRPYLFLRSRRRSANAFALSEKVLEFASFREKAFELETVILSDQDLGIEFTAKCFYPDLTGNFNKIEKSASAFLPELFERAQEELEENLQKRQPPELAACKLYLPASFLQTTSHEPFELEAETAAGATVKAKLSYDEGRWVFLELACRHWFPHCFLIHSTWTAREDRRGEPVYFFPLEKLLAKAVLRAALDRTDIFPRVGELENLATALRPTAAFGKPDAEYISLFDWESFFEATHRVLDEPLGRDDRRRPHAHARRLLYLMRNLIAELRIRRIAKKLLSGASFTPAALCTILETAEFVPADEELQNCLRRLENSPPQLITEHYLPGIKNLLAVILCFYSLPTKTIAKFYDFWMSKEIPTAGTRPTEKFSVIGRKLNDLQFTKSLSLPAQADGKSKFLFVPLMKREDGLRLVFMQNHKRSTSESASEENFELTTTNCEDFLRHVTAHEL